MYIFWAWVAIKVESRQFMKYLRDMTILLHQFTLRIIFDYKKTNEQNPRQHWQLKLNFRILSSCLCFCFCLASLQASFGYPMQEGLPFEYPCNAYGNNNSTNHNHNAGNSIHVNSSMATGLGKLFHFFSLLLTNFIEQKKNLEKEWCLSGHIWFPIVLCSSVLIYTYMLINWINAPNSGHRRTPCVLTPPSTPINSDLSAMNVSNGLPAHLYAQSTYRASDFTNDKCSPMDYTSSTSSTPTATSTNAYVGHQQQHHSHHHPHQQTTAVDLYTDLYNGYSTTCGQPNDFNVDLPTMDMPTAYNINSYGYESHKFNGDQNSGYFENEKKFDVSTIDGSRNLCVPNSYMHYNNCWLSRGC